MGLGMPEVVLILVIALIVFGPRKLPELGKSLGQAMGQFRKASDEFKRTWEQEVELEKFRLDDTTASTASSSASSSYDSGYSADSDYQYGYDSGEPAGATETASAAAATSTVANTSEPGDAPVETKAAPKAEAHWI